MPPTTSHQTGGGIPLPLRWGAGIGGVILLLVLAGGGGSSANDELVELASETCSQIDGATLLRTSFIVEAAVEDATDLGHTDTQLFSAMWDECPVTMQQIADAVEELQ